MSAASASNPCARGVSVNVSRPPVITTSPKWPCRSVTSSLTISGWPIWFVWNWPSWSRISTTAASPWRLWIVFSRTFSMKTLGSSPASASSPMPLMTSTPPWRRSSSAVRPAGYVTLPLPSTRSRRRRWTSSLTSAIENGFGR